MAYSMSTTGTSNIFFIEAFLFFFLLVDEKLQYTFKLFDADGNGLIDILEMETVFVALVAIATSSESDQMKRNKKKREDSIREDKIRREKEELQMMAERERELENRKYQVKAMSLNFKEKLQRSKRSSISLNVKRVQTAKGRRRRECSEDCKEKLENALEISKELSDPLRDYRKYDTRKRAQELFASFDSDNSGFITESQFIEGCKSDETFVKIFSEPNKEFILGFSDD